MKISKKKIALSLPEALITLLIIAITASVSAPLLLKKFAKKEQISHGIWECKLGPSGHTVREWRRDGTLTKGPVSTGNMCKFVPPPSATDFHVDICGSASEYGCDYKDGTHVYMVYPSLNGEVKVQITGKKVFFGDEAYAYTKDSGARVMVIY